LVQREIRNRIDLGLAANFANGSKFKPYRKSFQQRQGEYAD